MSRVIAICKREYSAFFRSPMGWVILAIFMLIFGLYFGNSIANSSVDLAGNIGFAQYFLFIIIPLVTMRMFAEDRRNGTEVLLYTSPASTFEIVLGKYLAAFLLFLTMTASTLIYFVVAALYKANFDISILGAYLGFLLLGAVYVAIGIFSSAMTENQIIAAVISFVIILLLMMLDFLAAVIGNAVSTLIGKVNFFNLTEAQLQDIGQAVTDGMRWLSPSARLTDFIIGLFALAPILFFISMTAVFVYLTNRIIEKRRWSQR